MKHSRHTIRLKHYDYSQEGMYFITICTQDRRCILSKIYVGADVPVCSHMKNEKHVGAHDCAQKNIQCNNMLAKIKLTNIGQIVKKEILRTQIIKDNIKIADYVIMPNHVHIIIQINERAQSCAPTIGNIIRGIKSASSKEIGYTIWQRNYYEHIIRNEKEYLKILEYIENNPAKWSEDKYYIKD